uniref:Uncharacterized protein n=1 Tax=Panagrellus redivivus TaxID=6233 RepID=A0A7E4VIV4_PANRE
MSWKAFTDYFWVKEPHPTPEIDDFFLNRTIGPLILVVLNSILACFAFFVIWTQSSSLGSFKWYMLNQLVIAQAMEFALWLISPVMMGSYMAFYAAGVYGYFATTKTLYLSWFIGLAGAVHIFFGIYLSLFNRFVFLFKPHLKKWLHNKYTFALIVLCHAGFHAIYIWAAESSVMNHDDMVELARNESGQTFDPWLKDPRFVYFSEFEGRLRAFAFIVLCIVIMVFLNLVGIFLSLFNRYVFLFKPHLKKYLHNKYTLGLIVLCHAGFDVLFIYGANKSVKNHDAMVELTQNETGHTFDPWLKDPSLGSFKWYMLNQLVIAQTMEFGILLYSPVMMGSYLAVYAAGVYGYFATTEMLYLSLFLGCAGSIHIFYGIFLSLSNRFVFLFKPHLKKWLHNKYTLALIVLCHAGFDAIFIWGAESSVMNHDAMVELARNETGHTFDAWLSDPRFLYVSEFDGRLRAFSFIVLCTLIVIFFTLVGIMIWFIVMVFILKRTSKTLSDFIHRT